MKLYDYKQVEEYITRYDLSENVDIIPGALIDTYVIYHENGVIEIFEEKYLNDWSSALTRRHYKRMPARIASRLKEMEY